MSLPFNLRLIIAVFIIWMADNFIEIIIVIISMAIIIISFNNLDSYFQGARIPAEHKSEFYKHIKPESNGR